MPDWRTNCDPMNEPAPALSEDGFLGGRLRLRQPKRGHRAGHDAMLLAAATPARPGDRVADLGAGVGAAGLAVAKRVNGIELILVEIDQELAELARDNASANAVAANTIVLDVTSNAETFASAGLGADSVDVVLMNPPFNDATRHRASPEKAREVAHVAPRAALERWVHASRRILKSGGHLVMIWRADGITEVLTSLDRGFGSVVILPVHAGVTSPAIRILVRATKGGRAPARLLPALSLNGGAAQAEAAEAILAGEGVLPLATA
jgi:tRNA1(Val) A37 N6-methylase TrmN6